MDELSVAVPTKGVKYVFACKCWLAKDRGDGLTSRVFNVLDAEAISICKRVRKHEQTVLKRRVLASGRKRRGSSDVSSDEKTEVETVTVSTERWKNQWS